MLNIFTIVLILAALAALFGIVLFIARTVSKRRMNKRLEEDRETLASGRVPSDPRRHTSTSLTAVGLALSIVALALSVVTVIIVTYSDLTASINHSENLFNKRIQDLEAEVRDLRTDCLRSSSMLSSFTVMHSPDSFDPDTLTETVRIDFMLKSLAPGETVSLTLNGETIEAEGNGSCFTAYLTKGIFDNMNPKSKINPGTDETTLLLTVSGPSGTRSEIVSPVLFSTVYDLWPGGWRNYIPTVSGWYSVQGVEVSRKNDKYTVDGDFFFTLLVPLADDPVTSFSVRVTDGTTVLDEWDLTSQIVQRDKYGDTNEIPLQIKKTYPAAPGSTLILESVVTDARGYTVITQIDSAYRPGEPGSVHREGPYHTVTAPDGTVVFSE